MPFRLLPFLCLVAVTFGTAHAQQSHENGRYTGIASGWYFPSKKWSSNYSLGGGGSYVVGYEHDPLWSAQFDVNMWLCAGGGIESWDIKMTPELMRAFGRGAATPFAFIGVGAEYQQLYPARSSTIKAVVPVGAGVQWHLPGGARFYLEGIYYFAAATLPAHDVPVLAGFQIPL
jgi:hypothetical protein